MVRDVEDRILGILAAVEMDEGDAAGIEAMGPEAVGFLCDLALGARPELGGRVRRRAVDVVLRSTAPQAEESLALLVDDEQPAIALRALRAVAAREAGPLAPRVGRLLLRPETDEVVAAEAVRTLRCLGTRDAKRALAEHVRGGPHRDRAVVRALEAEELGANRGGTRKGRGAAQSGGVGRTPGRAPSKK